MRKQTAGGALVFIETKGGRRYLLLKKNPRDGGHWDLSKGYKEGNETYLECAKREFIEEAGITTFDVIPGFRLAYRYKFKWGGKLIDKKVVFYLFRIYAKKVKLSPEHTDYVFADPKKLNKTKYKYPYKLIEKAEAFLSKSK